MSRSKDLSDFDKGQIVTARRLGQSISETARLVGCSQSAVLSTYRQSSEEGQTTNQRQGVGRPRLIDARGHRRLSRLVRTDRRYTVAQVTENFNGGHGRNVSQFTVHRTLLRMGLHSRRLVRVPMMTPVHHRSAYNGHASVGTGPWSSGRRSPGPMSPVFFYITWMAVYVCTVYLGK